jgi:N6-adenosine-specific RNA methylase IME4
MREPEYRAFREDIAERGIRVPLEVTAKKIVLDGRQRLRAARELKLPSVPVRIVEPKDAFVYMLKAAILHRHLAAGQRAALIVELDEYEQLREQGRKRQRANLQGQPEVATLPPRGKSRELAGEWAGVSGRTIQDALTVREHDPEALEHVKHGDAQLHVVARQIRRALREAALPEPPPIPEGPFELIYADPPWSLGNPDGPHAPENHYPTMHLDDIKELDIPTAENAVLFLWAPTSILPQALEVIQAWGFEYKSAGFWDKGSIGPGVWFRNEHEQLLVARRGNYPPPAPERRIASVIRAKRGRHSQKPAVFYELIERMYPRASKLELFARGKPRPGWAAWGNEVEP